MLLALLLALLAQALLVGDQPCCSSSLEGCWVHQLLLSSHRLSLLQRDQGHRKALPQRPLL